MGMECVSGCGKWLGFEKGTLIDMQMTVIVRVGEKRKPISYSATPFLPIYILHVSWPYAP